MMYAGYHFLNEVRALLHNELPVFVQSVWIEHDTTKMSVDDGSGLDGVHATERLLLALFIQIRQMPD